MAIHMLTNISAFQTKAAIAERLKLSPPTVAEALDYLSQVGLVEKKGDRFRITQNRIHLKKDSDWIFHFHHNIRQYAIQKLVEPIPEDFHYSMMVAISLADRDLIRKKIQKMVKDIEPVLENTKGEDVFAFSIDLFKI